MAPTTLTDLPPELLDHVVEFVGSANTVANLEATNKTLQAFVEKNAWRTFVYSRFPCIGPGDAPSYKHAARSLTTLSKAWNRRALVARHIEPQGKILNVAQDQILDRWQRPRGQTLGFTPQLDCFEDGDTSILAFSAGAEICIRRKRSQSASNKDASWTAYRPHGAVEGKDDVTSLHLLRHDVEEPLQVITGTANGNLQLLHFPKQGGGEIIRSHFVTQGQPVRSTSVLQQRDDVTLLAATSGDSRISLYDTNSGQSTVDPSSTIGITTRENGRRNYRAWSSQFLSSTKLAVGLGPCPEPLQIYSITPSGIDKQALRKCSLQNDLDDRIDDSASAEPVKKPSSSIYPIAPLAPETHSMAGSEVGQVFLSGAYDGIIRLHDLRSPRDVEQSYTDPTDESAIYSLLPRGRESVVAGASRHSLLKIFDLRLGAKAYSYLDAAGDRQMMDQETQDWNVFLKRHSATYPGRGGGNNWARRSAESSVYSLASPSSGSPFIYAGLENAVLELGFTSMRDPYPDPVFTAEARSQDTVLGFSLSEVVDLSMYDQTPNLLKLKTQRTLSETIRLGDAKQQHVDVMLPDLDERWRVAS